MKFKLYQEVVLLSDILEKNLKKGDIATVIDFHPSKHTADGYSLEVFNALGDTIAVLTLPESGIDELKESEVLSIRVLENI
ncbi:DUF4926 domain-containing protein [Membranicola marinus]|uniref:DUF4926 domain-containing protein n=1 Tax=Membranihabitans marinus TaxID=1227546 RepID=A0A953HYA1_9BACT|nr:DUF4926 domain-containing protein [Membranihabitans marinus]MBY5960003.1 DUF4926 domain-containing protein [Membranihabitans marinus]